MTGEQHKSINKLQQQYTSAQAVPDDGDLVQRVLVLVESLVDLVLRGKEFVCLLPVQLLEADVAHQILPRGGAPRTHARGRG